MCHSRGFWDLYEGTGSRQGHRGSGRGRRGSRHHRRRHGFGFEFGPRGPRRGFFRPGEVRLALLSLLEEQAGHGYDLMRRLEKRSGGHYKASAGTVYPVLQQLEDEGLVTSETAEGKRVYTITEDGITELKGEQERIDRIWNRAGRWKEWEWSGGPEGVEIGVAIARVAKVAFKVVGRKPQDAEGVRRILEKTLDELRDLGRP